MELILNLNMLDNITRAWIEDEARRTSVSVEQVIERLIQRGVAFERQAARAQRYHDLDSLAGTWSTDEADAFQAATVNFAQIDTTLWR